MGPSGESWIQIQTFPNFRDIQIQEPNLDHYKNFRPESVLAQSTEWGTVDLEFLFTAISALNICVLKAVFVNTCMVFSNLCQIFFFESFKSNAVQYKKFV